MNLKVFNEKTRERNLGKKASSSRRRILTSPEEVPQSLDLDIPIDDKLDVRKLEMNLELADKRSPMHSRALLTELASPFSDDEPKME